MNEMMNEAHTDWLVERYSVDADTMPDFNEQRSAGRPMTRVEYLAWCGRMGITNPRFVPSDTDLDTPPF